MENKTPVYKICGKQVPKNYRSVSLLPICRKIFEISIYNDLFEILLRIQSSGSNQDDLFIYQISFITHELYQPSNISVGVAENCILGPFVFLIHINDLPTI